MSMRYKEIQIPAGASEEFEEWVRQHGGTIKRGTIKRPPTPTEGLAVVWRRETQSARELLEQLRYPNSSEKQGAITDGLRQLVADTFVEGYFEDPMRDSARKRRFRPMALQASINWNAVQETLAAYFESCLDDERMKYYHVTMPKGKTVITRPSQEQVRVISDNSLSEFPYLTPREVSAAIQFYGLASGKRIPKEEVAAAHGLMMPSSIDFDILNIKSHLLGHQPIRHLVLLQHP